jgi:hypothetical protein
MISNTFRIVAAFILFEGLTTSAYAAPLEVTESSIKNCRFLGDVDGYSGYGKHLEWKPLAKVSTIRKADTLGATDIVYTNFRPIGGWNGKAEARVYACR